MDSKENLIHSYLLDGKGGAKTLSWDEIKLWKPQMGILWVHLNYQSETSREWLKNESKLDPVIIEDMISEDIRPRCFVTHDGVSVFLRGVNLNPGANPEDMISIRVWIDDHRIITTRNRKVLSINDLKEALQKGIGPKTQTEFIVMLNERLVYRMGTVISDIENEIDEIEEAILTEEAQKHRLRIAELRRQIIHIRRYLAPQREALSALKLESSVNYFNDHQKLRLNELSDRVIHYIEDLDASRDRCIIIQEEIDSRLSEILNSQMFILSVATVFFLPLTFITGLLGINVGGIPGSSYPNAFLIVCVFLVIFSIFLISVFKFRKWF